MIDYEKKYNDLRAWYFDTFKVVSALIRIKGKGDAEFKMFADTYFHWCGNCSEESYSNLRKYLKDKLTPEKFESLNLGEVEKNLL